MLDEKGKKVGYVEVTKLPTPSAMKIINTGAYLGIGQVIGWSIGWFVILPIVGCSGFLLFLAISAIGAS